MSDEGRTRVSRAEWAKRVQRWQDSGLSAAEFGAEIGVNARTLTYWKWVFRKQAGEPVKQVGVERPKSEAAAAFVEVRAPHGTSAFELTLGNGRRLQIPAAFDVDTLVRLLAVLERA